MSTTRLLILGVLRIWQPAHGYSIRKRLESWHVDEWASVAFGSIYFALNKMADEGLVERLDEEQPERRPGRHTYKLTGRGEAEFQRLLREHWSKRKPIVDPFLAALAFMPSVPKDELLQLLSRRVALARRDAEALEAASRSAEVSPRYVGELALLTAAHARAEIEWCEAAIEKIQRGELP
jgi:DNA-binding PadR family transcriptional regulator